MPGEGLEIGRESLGAADARTLIAALNHELDAAYPEPGATHFGLTDDEVAPGRGAFLMARDGGEPVGCGAVRTIERELAEIKRMYVAPAMRGRGLARRLLEALEDEARAIGAKRVVLETGTRQAAAIALYRAMGYAPIPLFGEYQRSPDTSLCFGKSLEADVDRFVADGFIVVRRAFSSEVARACADVVATQLRAQGVDVDDPSTWTSPVVRLDCPWGPPFAAAGTSPALTRMYDRLLGAGRWIPRRGVGGTIPVRFPVDGDPGDAGWHIDGSYDVDGRWWVNVHSRVRGLLALFLFTDVGADDAPTEILVGSHLDVPRVLAPHGERGVDFAAVTDALPVASYERPRVFVTGRAGDVYLCHPFLVHRATWPHRGVRPRMMAQPEVGHHEPFALRDPASSAVERAILLGLADAPK